MYDNYCTLEEAWGKDYKKEEKRRRKRDTPRREPGKNVQEGGGPCR